MSFVAMIFLPFAVAVMFLVNMSRFLCVGTSYNHNFAQKDGGTSSHHSAHDGGYGGAQVSTFISCQMDTSQVETFIIF